MKAKTTLAAALIVVAILFGLNLMAQETPITKSQLPATAQAFLSRYFPDQKINRIVKDKDLMKTEYEVYLTGEIKVEFDGSGKWKEVDGKQAPIPAGFILPDISKYVSAHFSGQKITKIERANKKYEVELSDGTDLDFGLNGKFLRIDD